MSNKILATDLDGTFIPLEGRSENVADLQSLKELLQRMEAMLVFVTGRHYSSVMDAIAQFDLPSPDWIICDVGTSIYQSAPDGGYEFVQEYAEHQSQIVSDLSLDGLRAEVANHADLRIQEPEKQGLFKLSFYVEQDLLQTLSQHLGEELERRQAPWSIVSSVDPFTGDGLMDFLPKNVSKAFALSWWTHFCSLDPHSIVFAGDSGNDYAAMIAGYKTIVVGNASRQLARQVQEAHRTLGSEDQICLTPRYATSGVLDGCLKFWA